MRPGEFVGDCTRCDALCCLFLSFDRSERFGIDKPAEVPCPHLLSNQRCGIHARRREHGFAGCESYDCLGAGQRVCQEIFPRRSWRQHPELVPSLARAFATLRVIQELRQLLMTAAAISLPNVHRERLSHLRSQLEPESGWSEASLSLFEQGNTARDISQFLHSLRGVLPPRRRLPLL